MFNDRYFYLKLETHYLVVPYADKERRVRVLLPKDYNKDAHLRYPVVYFHDGQNVFYSRESYSGHSWKTIPMIKRNPDLPKMILVGIDNDGDNRMNEYTPWKITKSPLPGNVNMGGQGHAYAAFVMDVVKPFIDETYRSKSEKEFTGMIGSSLGGNITSFMGIEYKDQIGRLGIFSLANWITSNAFNQYLEERDIDTEQRVYIQVGTQEGDDTDRQLMHGNMKQAYIDCSLDYAKKLVLKGLPIEQVNLNIFADEKHNEEAWARHLPDAIRFLTHGW